MSIGYDYNLTKLVFMSTQSLTRASTRILNNHDRFSPSINCLIINPNAYLNSELSAYRFVIYFVLYTQVSIYANEKFEVTSFVAENLEIFREHFIILDSNDQPVKDLHKFSDVYNQITRVVESVSYSISKVCMYVIHM